MKSARNIYDKDILQIKLDKEIIEQRFSNKSDQSKIKQFLFFSDKVF